MSACVRACMICVCMCLCVPVCVTSAVSEPSVFECCLQQDVLGPDWISGISGQSDWVQLYKPV